LTVTHQCLNGSDAIDRNSLQGCPLVNMHRNRPLNLSVGIIFFCVTSNPLPSAHCWAEEEHLAIDLSVQSYIQQRVGEFDDIPAERKTELARIAAGVRERLEKKRPARLTFICTHNSRRSQIAQVWAAVAAGHYGIRGVESYSGGTEATAFNSRAVAALQRTGLVIERLDSGDNPHYAVQIAAEGEPLVCFSKVYGDPPNPKQDYFAVMTCSQADKSCPIVAGCDLRSPITYDDPKLADDTPEETARYDERCCQISREMLYLFSQVASKTAASN
jgi:arsenate reductase